MLQMPDANAPLLPGGTPLLNDTSVSVVVPAYNAAPYIAEAVSSVPIEGPLTVEIIVVDDGSTDGTADLVKELAAINPRLRTCRVPISGGPSAARNIGFSMARGDWIALLDADDHWLDGRLERLISEAQSRDLDLIADNQLLLDERTSQSRGLAFPDSWMASEQDLTLEDLIEKDWPGRQRCRPLGNLKPVIRRSTLQRLEIAYREEVKVAEDFLFYAELLLAQARFGLSQVPGYVYRMRSGSASRATAATFQTVIDVNRRVMQLCEQSMSNPPDRDRVCTLLEQREQAVRYQHFTFLAKTRDFKSAFKELSNMNGLYVTSRLLRAAAVRAGMMTDDAVSA